MPVLLLGPCAPFAAAPGPDRSGEPDAVPIRDLCRGLRAGDLETVLLTVAMAAEDNRMPTADPEEAARILAFLGRLAAFDAALPPPCPGGEDPGPEGPRAAG